MIQAKYLKLPKVKKLFSWLALKRYYTILLSLVKKFSKARKHCVARKKFLAQKSR